ncbi:MAG TPA: SRPBCC family protein [Acidimicrobiales bacterium]|nr:SRPBCC family protein [Acidimicrobiales bacterium]
MTELCGEATVTIGCSARDVIELVLDLERYKTVDHKIGKVSSFSRDGDRGTVHFAGKLRGLPTPRDRQTFEVTDGRHLTFRSIPSRWPGWAARFEGSFACDEQTDGTTVVTHRECFHFNPAIGWLVRPILGRWLAADTPLEMARMKAALEAR